MIRGVTRRGNRDDVAGLRQLPARSKGTKGFGCEAERFRIEPRRPTMRKIAAQAAEGSAGGPQFARCDQDFAIRKVRKPAVMIHMQMGKHHPLHIARCNAERTELRTDLLFTVNAERDFPAEIGMKRLAGLEQMRALVSTTMTPSGCSMTQA